MTQSQTETWLNTFVNLSNTHIYYQNSHLYPHFPQGRGEGNGLKNCPSHLGLFSYKVGSSSDSVPLKHDPDPDHLSSKFLLIWRNSLSHPRNVQV